jgi:cytochrome P450
MDSLNLWKNPSFHNVLKDTHPINLYFTSLLILAVFTETLRKYPILPFLDRMCCSDYELPAPNGNGTITLPAGTGVYIPILGIHYDSTYYPEPEKFNPDRFTEENKRSRPKYAYIPFGEGPRMCIGKDRQLKATHKNFKF